MPLSLKVQLSREGSMSVTVERREHLAADRAGPGGQAQLVHHGHAGRNDIAVDKVRLAAIGIRCEKSNRAYAAGLLNGREDTRVEAAITTKQVWNWPRSNCFADDAFANIQRATIDRDSLIAG
jgi:hypothetical protein